MDLIVVAIDDVGGIDGIDGIEGIRGIEGIDVVGGIDGVAAASDGVTTFTNRQRKMLRDKINKLSQTEHDEIFKILKNNEVRFTQNKNGVFFDISFLSLEVALEVERFVDFCTNNQVELDEYDKQINECKMNNCFDRLKNSVPLTSAITSNVVLDDWQGLLQETRSNEKIAAFVSLLENSCDKLCVKRANTKFINAKKKYSKKTIMDKKNDTDLYDNLTPEVYMI